MPAKTIQDEGQTLPPPRGKVLGVVDTEQQFQAVVAALANVRFDQVTAVKGQDGVNLLERFKGFFFSDADEPVLNRHIDELKAGHTIFAVVAPASQAEKVAEVATQHGARFIVHFGFAATTWLRR